MSATMDTRDTASKAQAAIERAKRDKLGALVAYLPAGFPTVEESITACRAVAAEGADLIEIGIPYSDPVMDGPVIQHATGQALSRGFRVKDVLQVVEAVSGSTDAAVLVMSYWNPIVRYGVSRFARDFAQAGGAGLITPDLIPDEAGEWMDASDEHGLDRVFLVAPSSTDARLASTAEASRGFIYAASTMGITGERSTLGETSKALVHRVKETTDKMTCVGLGVSTPEQIRDILGYADGAIVGSALVRALDEGGVDGLRRATAHLASGLHR